MRFELEIDEINKILAILNETPTKMGVYPLVQKLVAQGNSQQMMAEATPEAPPLQKAED